MRFITGHLNYKITVQRAEHVLSAGGQRMGTTRALRAVFENGICDTEYAARVYNWTDEERKLVEEALLRHVDYRRQGGFYPIEEASDAKLQEASSPLNTGGCTFTIVQGGAALPCGQVCSPGTPFCAEHLAESISSTILEASDVATPGAVGVTPPLGAGVPTAAELVGQGVGGPHIPTVGSTE